MKEYRQRIDEIDDEMQKLFVERMEVVKKIAFEKKAKGLEVLNKERETEILTRLSEQLEDPILSGLYQKFIINTMELSKLYQELIMKEN